MIDPENLLYQTRTRDIVVSVRTAYLDDQSDPDENRFVWAYHVTIENSGRETVQLLSRYWRITDAIGQVHEVSGPGVVGEQPVLEPGQSFAYTSGTPLSTPTGIMLGRYQMETTGGEPFEVDIPVFSLDSPHHQAQLH